MIDVGLSTWPPTSRRQVCWSNVGMWPDKSYSLPAILGAGGICVDQAYFATQAGKAPMDPVEHILKQIVGIGCGSGPSEQEGAQGRRELFPEYFHGWVAVYFHTLNHVLVPIGLAKVSDSHPRLFQNRRSALLQRSMRRPV